LVVRYGFRMERYNHGVTNVKVGDVLFFYTVQGEPTGTHSYCRTILLLFRNAIVTTHADPNLGSLNEHVTTHLTKSG
jgi:hypothetical protein